MQVIALNASHAGRAMTRAQSTRPYRVRKGTTLGKAAVSPDQFSNLGDLVKYLRRRQELSQLELALRVRYSDTQISRIEQNQRVPDAATITALFVPALHLEREPEWTARLLELAAQARRGETPETRQPANLAPKNNLPAFLTTFIGREGAQADLIEQLATHRLVTLTGSGGVGKTRLAVHVAEKVSGAYANGVWLIELASLSDPTLLPQRVASVLGIITQSATSSFTELLVNFLRGKTVLLILDNCEHLLEPSAVLVDALVKSCPQLKVLATSREALGIPGEIQYRLPSLELPNNQETLARIKSYESVRLFQERARLAQPDFKLTAENAPAVAQICSRLDGIPLAIELAAARVTILSTAEIAARLDDRFNLLTGGSRTVLPRQQTMRASIDWSWDLISGSERTLLGRLTVFAGGWTLEAAESVCGAGSIESGQVSDLLSRLVAKSLAMVTRVPGRPRRFHLHETIKQYAREKLSGTTTEASAQEIIESRHLNYFLKFARQAEPALHGPQQLEWYDRLAEERANIRAALKHASQSDLEAGLYLAGELLEYWFASDVREGLSVTTDLIQAPGAAAFPHARAKAGLTRGNILWNMQQFAAARSAAQESLETFRAFGDKEGECDSLMSLGRALQFVEGMEARTECHTQALALARSLGDVWRQAVALSMLGWDQRDPDQGRANWEEAIALLRQSGDWFLLARTLGVLGFTVLSNGDIQSAEKLLDEAYEVNQQSHEGRGLEFILTGKSELCLLRGEYGQARAFMQQNCDMHQEVGNRMGYLWGCARLANIALHQGELIQAHQLLAEVIRNFQADQNKNGLVFALEKLTGLYLAMHIYRPAPALIGWCDATRGEIGDPRQRLQQNELDQTITTLIARLGAAAYQEAYAFGSTMTLDDAVQFALQDKVYGSLENDLDS